MIDKIIDNNEGELRGVVQKAYDDLVHPTAKATGAIISYPFRSFRALCFPLEKWIVNREESLNVVAEEVQKKLEAIPDDKRCTPEAYVAVPTIQQICLCQSSDELRKMYANLLVASMNIDTKDSILPGFVTIIGQLSPDEARLLKHIGEEGMIPYVEIRLMEKEIHGSYKRVIKYFAETKGIVMNENFDQLYFDNLSRLNLIDCCIEQMLVNCQKEYSRLYELADESVKHYKEKYDFEYVKGSIQITDFGRAFYKICSDI